MEALQWDLPWRWTALSDLSGGLTEMRLSDYGPQPWGGEPAAHVPLQTSLDLLARLHLPHTELDAWAWTHALAHLPSLRVATFSSMDDGSLRSPVFLRLPALLSLQELHVAYICYVSRADGAAPGGLRGPGAAAYPP